MSEPEGAIQFQLEHSRRALDPVEAEAAVLALAGWRRILRQTGLIGRRPERYEGAAYGNLSVLATGAAAGGGSIPPFLITGTQTSDLEELTAGQLVRVEACELERNAVRSSGMVYPSSETLTHAAVYEAAVGAGAVLHVHSREIWTLGAHLGLATTSAAAACGTPQMALGVRQVVSRCGGPSSGLLTMGGHEDGVLAWGPDAASAAGLLLRALAEAYVSRGPLRAGRS
jgi:ribulose-5-phosphate 4-epimerase/fuculose-1-phosphate aldolase